MPTVFEIKKQMVEVGKLMYQKGLVIAKHGNISYKINDNEYLCTPGGLCKAFLTPDKLVRVDAEGNPLEKDKKPTSEIRMHIAIYRLRPDIHCIVHAQPAATTAFAISDIDATKFVLPGDKKTYFGYVPAAAYDKKNHDANTLADYMSDRTQMAYIFHGDSSLSVGDTLYNAFDNIESLEHYCRVSIFARGLDAIENATCDQLRAELERRKCGTHSACAKCPKCGKTGCHGACACADADIGAAAGKPNASGDDAVREVVQRVLQQLGK